MQIESNGLKEALEYVVKKCTDPVETMEIGDSTYSNKEFHLVATEAPTYYAEPLKVATLTGLVDYIRQNRDGLDMAETLVVIKSPSHVALISVPDEKKKRSTYIEAVADLPMHNLGQWDDIEQLLIRLQTAFAPSDDRETLLKYLGNIKEDETVSTTDDGVSQRIVAKTGVSSVDAVILPNPVELRPYRTFSELEQIGSQIILRLRKGNQAALFNSDGGVWKIKARAAIKQYLEAELAGVKGVCILG